MSPHEGISAPYKQRKRELCCAEERLYEHAVSSERSESRGESSPRPDHAGTLI